MDRGKLQKWKIPKEKLINWKRLNPDVPKNIATDCTINVLHFLGVIENREIAENLAKYRNMNKRGTYNAEVLKFIFDSFNKNPEFKVNHVINTKTEEEILNELNNDEYTIAQYSRANTEGHSVIITRLDNEIYVYDPQQETLCHFQKLPDMIKDQKYVSTDYIIKDKIARTRKSTTIKLRKSKSSNDRPVKRRRTSSTPVHSKTRKSQKKSDSISNLVKDFETKLKVSNNNTKKRKLSNKSKSES
jgi:hypothetical protein